MSTGRVKISVDTISSKSGEEILSEEKAGYTEPYALDDLEDQHWITKNMLVSYVPTTTDLTPTTISRTTGQAVRMSIDYAGTYASVYGSRNIGAFVYVKDTDPADDVTVIFRRSQSAIILETRSGDSIGGNIQNLIVYFEEDISNPGFTGKDQYLVLFNIN